MECELVFSAITHKLSVSLIYNIFIKYHNHNLNFRQKYRGIFLRTSVKPRLMRKSYIELIIKTLKEAENHLNMAKWLQSVNSHS